MESLQIKSRVLADEVTRVLEEALVSGHLKPGDRVNEAEWATRLGVSRSPMREAIRRLAQSGLVVLTSHRGAYVPQLTRRDVREVYLLRGALEGLAASMAAATISDAQIDYLDSLASQMTQTDESTGSIQEIDFRFHEFLYTLSNHQRLIDVLRGLRAQIRGFIRVNQAYSLPDELAREHRAIISALRFRDPVTIRTVVEDHIVNAGRRVEANLPQEPETAES